MTRKTMLLLAAAICAVGATAEAPLWLRNSRISPDGKQIAFTYKGDIYAVPTTGGSARRLTSQASYDTAPVWSPDSRSIAFASDRHGNFDIYIMDAGGGPARRLTFDSARETPEAFSEDGASVYYTAAIQAPASSSAFPSGRLTQLYAVAADGSSAPRQIVGTAVQSISLIPGTDGSFLYQDVKGMENTWRKHHTSSTTRDIRLYDAGTGVHTNLTDRPGEDLNPVVSPDGSEFFYLSETSDSPLNVFAMPLGGKGTPRRVTDMPTHPVRYLSQAADGTLAFSWDGELYTLAPGAEKPRKVVVDIALDTAPETQWLNVSARDAVPSADGKQMAFTSRGEVFVASVDHESVKQVTHTPASEMQVAWHPEGRSLAYTSRRNEGRFNIYRADIVRKDDPNFSNATLIAEHPLVADDSIERTYPMYSPDGKQLAFIQDRNKLMVMDVATGNVRQLTDGSTYAYYDGGFDYEWSPDNRWIVTTSVANGHDPYTDIILINVADGDIINLTSSGYMDFTPRFVMGGNAVAFLTERYGMRNHASWGSMNDVCLVFLNRDAYDRFRLSEEDYELRKELEKNAKKSDDPDKNGKKDKKDKKGKKDKEGDTADESAKPIVVEKKGIEDRMMRITPYSSHLSDSWVDEDGKMLYYLSAVEGGYDLWKMDLDDWEPSRVSRLGTGYGAHFIPVDGGKTLFITGDKPNKFDTGSEKLTSLSASTRMLLDAASERDAMFDQVVVSEKEMFYDKNLHGADWEGLSAAYRRFLPHIDNNYDFAEMLSELLGELNVSHTGSGYRAKDSTEAADRTASLGLLYDYAYDGADGLRVAEVVTDGPFDNATTALRPGMVITAINGKQITPQTDRSELLNNLSGRKTLVSFRNPATGATADEVVLPISSGEMSDLLYDRWVKGRAALVDSLSNGRLGYVHIASMDDNSFRKVYSDALGKYNTREGLVIDIRWNGGGRLHEDIEVLFSGEKYLTQVIRGNESCDMPSRRYNKPTIMVMGEACYSNAHGTPWVYNQRGLGTLVGMPVPGTMTSVNWVTLQDPSLYFGVPIVGYRPADGGYLENRQLEPDIRVENLPQDVVAGRDAQIETAVRTLLEQIDSKD